MRMTLVLLAAAALTTTAAAAADSVTSTEHRLSPEEIEKVLDDAARKNQGVGAEAELPDAERGSPGTPIHGEVGFAIGTGGYRSAHGTAVIGLPGEGTAIIAMGTQRLPDNLFIYPGW